MNRMAVELGNVTGINMINGGSLLTEILKTVKGRKPFL